MAYNNVKVKARQVVRANTQSKDLGIVSNVPMGEWNATTQYGKLNTVRSHNATYQAKKDNKGVEPTVTTNWQEFWQVVAYDGNVAAVVPGGTYPNMKVGTATNDSNGNNIAQSLTDLQTNINAVDTRAMTAETELQENINTVANELNALVQTVSFAATSWTTTPAAQYYLGAVSKTVTGFTGKRIIQVVDSNNSPRGTWQGNTIYANEAFAGVAIMI